MSCYFNIGKEKIISYYNDDIFIDKSLLIKNTNNFMGKESKKIMSVTRPRRFGKTMTLSMLNVYYSKGCNSKRIK